MSQYNLFRNSNNNNQLYREKIIFTQINELFDKIIKLRKTKEFANFLQFLRRVPRYAPFNSALVFAQKPDCFYYATAKQWQERFGRKVRENAKPLLTLIPFGPVSFVYDYSDTEGEPISNEKLIYWWKDVGGTLNKKVVHTTIQNLGKFGIRVNIGGLNYIKNKGLHTFGYAKSSGTKVKEISLHPKYNSFYGKNDVVEKYSVLVHEIAHHFLGHLGNIRTKKENKLIIEDRTNVTTEIKEIEAELTTWIVLNYWGLSSESSVYYLSTWVSDEMAKLGCKHLNISLILATAKRIQNLGIKLIKDKTK